MSEGDYTEQQDLERSLMLKQIARIVAEAKDHSKPVRTAQHAPHLFVCFPHANMPIGRIVEEITRSAREAGVPIE